MIECESEKLKIFRYLSVLCLPEKSCEKELWLPPSSYLLHSTPVTTPNECGFIELISQEGGPLIECNRYSSASDSSPLFRLNMKQSAWREKGQKNSLHKELDR